MSQAEARAHAAEGDVEFADWQAEQRSDLLHRDGPARATAPVPPPAAPTPRADGELVEGCTILTASGRYVNPLDLRPRDISVDDIAHALGNQCRYSGHTRVFYSVADHSVRVSHLLADQGADHTTVLWGLLHDAGEAYLVDLPRPLKHHETFGAVYREAEQRAITAIMGSFDLPIYEPAAVKQADLILLATERRDLMPAAGEWAVLEGVELLPDTIVPLTPAAATATFLATYAELTDGDA